VVAGRARSLVLLLTAFLIVLGLAVLGADGVLISVSAALARLVDIDWPRWIHNLADMLQIVTVLFALLVWGSTRRRPASPTRTEKSPVEDEIQAVTHQLTNTPVP
jgi:hypothetical protein